MVDPLIWVLDLEIPNRGGVCKSQLSPLIHVSRQHFKCRSLNLPLELPGWLLVQRKIIIAGM